MSLSLASLVFACFLYTFAHTPSTAFQSTSRWCLLASFNRRFPLGSSVLCRCRPFCGPRPACNAPLPGLRFPLFLLFPSHSPRLTSALGFVSFGFLMQSPGITCPSLPQRALTPRYSIFVSSSVYFCFSHSYSPRTSAHSWDAPVLGEREVSLICHL